MVDNTFLGPTFQHPLLLGADLVLYSATKYLSGFSDMLAGVAHRPKLPRLIRKIRSRRGMFGNILQPDECWMLDGRLPTVALRMNRQSKNAQRLAEALAGPPAPERRDLSDALPRPRAAAYFRKAVRLPRRHLFHRIPGRASRRHSSSCATCGSRTTPSRWAAWRRSSAIPRAPPIPGCPREELAESGVTDGLVRVSVGIEDWRDLLADFEQALAAVG